MTAERWQQIENLYHAALERPPAGRGEYLTRQCDGDEALRREVESLLRNGDEAGFLDGHALEIAARQYVSIQAPDLTGRKLGRYDVISRLGAGGMGVVYRARDTRLKRDVALKVIPAAGAADAGRKRRFVQEARAASALNHPNIVSVYDIDEIEGIDFIAMECVPGKTLADVIGRKELPTAEAVSYATQIASALAAAHAAGIVHRDLKPGNVMINADGQVKVLDFGLAKLAEPFGDGKSTGSAWIAGTPAYMSPEQAEGRKVDARSDIFSFGAVLYEMLTGRAAFARDSMSASVAAILRDEPAPVPELAPGLRRLIARCLQKDLNRRYQAMADVKFALEDLEQQAPVVAITGSKRTKRWLLSATALTMIAAAIGIAWLIKRPEPVQQQLPVTQITFDGRMAIHPAISADGKYVAYASDRAGQGNLDIWVQALPTGEPVRLTKDEVNEDYPSFSPDGTKIAFRSERDGGRIYVIPVLGGESRFLAKSRGRPLYSPDGKHLLFSPVEALSDRQAAIMPAEGGEPRQVQAPAAHGVLFPIWAPESKQILAVGRAAGLRFPATTWFVLPLAGGRPIVSYERTDGAGVGTPLDWLRDNRILFSAQSGDAVDLWLARLLPGAWKVAKPFKRLTSGVGQIASASGTINGTIVFASAIAPTRLWSLPLPKEGQRGEGEMLAFPSSGSKDYFPSLSTTGKMAYLSQKSGKWDVWIRDLRTGTETWLASMEGTNAYHVAIVIRPDGSRVAYSNCPALQSCAVFIVPASGGEPEKLCDSCGQIRAWSSDGAVMASQEFVLEGGAPSGGRINRLDVHTGSKATMVEKRGIYVSAADFSPDGRWIAFQASPVARGSQLFVAPADGPLPIEPSRWIAITPLEHLDTGPHWSRDGKTIYFTSNRDGSNCLWAVQLDAATKKPRGQPFAVRHFHASPRQWSDAVWPIFSIGLDRIVIGLEQVQSDLWMMQLPE